MRRGRCIALVRLQRGRVLSIQPDGLQPLSPGRGHTAQHGVLLLEYSA